MMKWLVLTTALLLTACGTVKKIESGTAAVGTRMSVQIEGAWNHIDFPGAGPAQIWTMEGTPIDELRLYSGIKDGQVLQPAAGRARKEVVFRNKIATEEIVTLFESILTADDSVFKLLRVEPFSFAGRKGIRFEYERVRKGDGVSQLGVGFGTIDGGELFAMTYQAPRLVFYPRHQARVEAMARTIQLK